MSDEKKHTSIISIPSVSGLAKGAVVIVTAGMIVSAGFAAYNYWYGETTESNDEKTDSEE